MRRRLVALIVVAGMILGGMVSISSPFGVGLVIIRHPIVLLHDAAERVVRALFRPRGTSVPAPVSALRPAAVNVRVDAGPAGPTIEPPGGAAAKLTQVRRGQPQAEDDGQETPDRLGSQTQPEGDSSSLDHSGALRIAGRDQSDTDSVAQGRAPDPNPNGPQAPPNGQHTGAAAPPPSNSSANDGSADVQSPSVGQDGGEGRDSDGPERNEPGRGGEHGGRADRDDDHHNGDHHEGDHRDGDKGGRGHK